MVIVPSGQPGTAQVVLGRAWAVYAARGHDLVFLANCLGPGTAGLCRAAQLVIYTGAFLGQKEVNLAHVAH